MHWGLAGFERKRIERIVLNHPFFDMHAPLLTKKEIRAILAQGPRKSGPQVITEVKKELGLIDAPITQQKRTLLEALHDASFVPSFRRTVVLGALCLLLVLFMTLTVPGRAFAKEIYSIIIDFVDGTLSMRNSIPTPDQPASDFSTLHDGLTSPKTLAEALQYPIVGSNDKLIFFEYEMIGSDILSIRSKYQTSEGKKYTIIQEIHGGLSYWSFDIDVDKIDYQKLDPIQGVELFAGTATDGNAFVVGYSGSFSIKISGRELTPAETILVAEHILLYDN